MEKFSRGIFFCDYRCRFSFLNRHHHTTSNASTATNNTTKTTHMNTTKHNQKQTNTNTSPISNTDTCPLHSKWHEVCTVMLGQLFRAWCEHVRPTGNWDKVHALWHSGKSARARVDELSLSLLLRGKRGKTRAGREKERGEKRESKKDREHERREGGKPSVCRFKTPPYVRSGRLRVYPENARMC